jgi:6-phosphogluconolactonase
MRALLALFAAFMAVAPVSAQPKDQKKAPPEWNVFVGTYTRPQKSKGIYAWRFQPATGKLTALGLAAETSNPSYLAVHPNQRFLYAVNENNNGAVTSFSIDDASGKLKQLNQVSSKGGGPCHLTTDRSGRFLYVANYNSGSIAAFPINEDGSLGEASAFIQHSGSSANPQRQKGPHAHDVVMSPDNHFVFTADLGLDQVIGYRFDPARGGMATDDGVITKIAPGSGPRHLAFRPDGRFLYVLNEMTSNVVALRYDAAKGSTEEMQTLSTLPSDFKGNNSGAEIAVHRSANYLYASNRGHDSIAIFRIDLTSGKLSPIGYASTRGKTPRGFGIDPTGGWLFAGNQESDNMSMFRIDLKTGNLNPVGDPIEVFAPVSVVFAAVK